MIRSVIRISRQTLDALLDAGVLMHRVCVNFGRLELPTRKEVGGNAAERSSTLTADL